MMMEIAETVLARQLSRSMKLRSLSIYVCVTCGRARERGLNVCDQCGSTVEGRTINVHEGFSYWVIFNTKAPPRGTSAGTSLKEETTVPHRLAYGVADILPALFHILHLPRTPWDLARQPWTALAENAQDLPQRIIVIPFDLAIGEQLSDLRRQSRPVLVFVPDRTMRIVRHYFPDSVVIDSTSIGPEFLQDHWTQIGKVLDVEDYRMVYPPKPCLESGQTGVLLPIRFLSRLRSPGANEGPSFEERGLFGAWFQHVETGVTNRAVRLGLPSDQIGDFFYTDEGAEILRGTRIPLSVALPGVSHFFVTRNDIAGDFVWVDGLWNHVPASDNERESIALDFLVTHDALGKHGVGVRLPPVSTELFDKLTELEHYFLNARPKPRIVWRLLRELGALADVYLSSNKDLRFMLGRAFSSITVFGGFPLGLVIPSGGSSPLATMIPVVYRPIMPLTDAVAEEASRPPGRARCDLREPVRVLVCECLDPSDHLRPISDAIWPALATAIDAPPSNSLTVRAVTSPAEIVTAVTSLGPHVLIISAHGFYDKEACVSGVNVGTTRCVGREFMPVPPIVILSACHVAPRGMGPDNIVDTLIRQGALVVIGTQVPIDAKRNGAFLSLLFESIALMMRRKIPGRTLLDAWQRALVLGALSDVMFASKRIRRWYSTAKLEGVSVSTLLAGQDTLARVRPDHVYGDWTEILIEYIARTGPPGFDASARTAIGAQGIIPETMFYFIAGRPEGVVIGDVVHFRGLDAMQVASADPS